MRKKEIIDFMRAPAGLTAAKALEAFEAFVDAVIHGLRSDGEVFIPRLGKLQVYDAPAQRYKNPRTGEEAMTKPRKRVRFKPTKGQHPVV